LIRISTRKVGVIPLEYPNALCYTDIVDVGPFKCTKIFPVSPSMSMPHDKWHAKNQQTFLKHEKDIVLIVLMEMNNQKN